MLNALRSLFTRSAHAGGVDSRDPYVAELFGLRPTASGEFVSPTTAASIPAVHACVQLISESIASLPLALYRRQEDGGRVVDRAHPLHRVLNEQANAVQTGMEFREWMLASVLLSGNAYALKEYDGRGAITALQPITSGMVFPERLVNGRLRYEVSWPAGGTERYTQDEVFHLRYRTLDGIVGLSPITIARETIGIARAQQEHEGALYRNGARIAGLLKMEGSFKDEEHAARFMNQLREAYAGAANSGKLMLLTGGVDYAPQQMSQRDAEFIESRRLTMEDIARIFRVPPPFIGILADATYSNITEQGLWLVKHCLRPWMVRIERAMVVQLLSTEARRTHVLEHNAEGLLRGSTTERFEAYRIAREWGWMSQNEIREKENLAPIEGGDRYLEPLNMQGQNDGRN